MKTAKLTLGIVTLVFSLIVILQSCVAGVGSAIIQSKDTSGAAGFVVFLFMVASGVLGIAARNSKGGAVAATILYALGGLIGVSTAGIYKDLIVWGVILFGFAVVFFISIFTQKYPKKTE